MVLFPLLCLGVYLKTKTKKTNEKNSVTKYTPSVFEALEVVPKDNKRDSFDL